MAFYGGISGGFFGFGEGGNGGREFTSRSSESVVLAWAVGEGDSLAELGTVSGDVRTVEYELSSGTS